MTEFVVPAGKTLTAGPGIKIYRVTVLNASSGSTWGFDGGAQDSITAQQSRPAPASSPWGQITVTAGSGGEVRLLLETEREHSVPLVGPVIAGVASGQQTNGNSNVVLYDTTGAPLKVNTGNAHQLQVQLVDNNGNVIVTDPGHGNLITQIADATGGILLADGSHQLIEVAGAHTVVLANGTASPAAASTVPGATLNAFDSYRHLFLYALLQGATGGTLDIYVQTSFDGGTTWIDVAHFAQLAAGAPQVAYGLSLSRVAPSDAIKAINPLSGTPTLAAGQINQFVGNAFRYVFVAGAGTTAGANQTILGYMHS